METTRLVLVRIVVPIRDVHLPSVITTPQLTTLLGETSCVPPTLDRTVCRPVLLAPWLKLPLWQLTRVAETTLTLFLPVMAFVRWLRSTLMFTLFRTRGNSASPLLTPKPPTTTRLLYLPVPAKQPQHKTAPPLKHTTIGEPANANAGELGKLLVLTVNSRPIRPRQNLSRR